MRRNPQKRANHAPRRPPRQSQRLPRKNWLPTRKHRTPISPQNNPNQKVPPSHEKTRHHPRNPKKHKPQKTNSNLLPKMRKPKNTTHKHPRKLANPRTILLRTMRIHRNNRNGTRKRKPRKNLILKKKEKNALIRQLQIQLLLKRLIAVTNRNFSHASSFRDILLSLLLIILQTSNVQRSSS